MEPTKSKKRFTQSTKTRDGKQNSTVNFPEWLHRWANLYGKEVYRGYLILDRALPRREKLTGRDLLKVFPITITDLRRAGLDEDLEMDREEWIKLLLKNSNICYSSI